MLISLFAHYTYSESLLCFQTLEHSSLLLNLFGLNNLCVRVFVCVFPQAFSDIFNVLVAKYMLSESHASQDFSIVLCLSDTIQYKFPT